MSKFNFNGILTQNNQIKELPIEILVPYHNHQFRLYSGERLYDLVQSIRQNGILNPIIVQPLHDGSKYEILSGHNRVEGAKIVGLEYIPALIKENLSSDEAEIYVIETNLLQRGFNDLLISEQASVLKVQHSKMFSQGKRNDIIAELQRLESGTTSSPLGKKLVGDTSLSKVGNEYGLSKNTVARLLRVNYLIQPFKDMLDDKTLPLRVGVELSYISNDVQNVIYEIVSKYDKKIDIKLSKNLRSAFKDNNTSFDFLESLIVDDKKSNSRTKVKVSIDKDVFSKYFDKKTSNDEVAETIQKALDMYFSNNN